MSAFHPALATSFAESVIAALESSRQLSASESQLFSSFVSLSFSLAGDTLGSAASSDILHRVQGKNIGAINLHLVPLGSGSSFFVSCVLKDDEESSWDSVVFKHTIPTIRDQDPSKVKDRIQSMMLELRVLCHNPIRKSENVVRLLGIAWELDPFVDERHWPVLVLERAAHGTLQDYLRAERNISFLIKTSLAMDVILGLELLHKCGIFHGDVKLENILIFDNEDPESKAERPVVAKLADFGGVVHDIVDLASLPTRTTFWAAPETNQPVSPEGVAATDVYALGFALCRLFANGADPFENFPSAEAPAIGDALELLVDEMKGSDETMLTKLFNLLRFDSFDELQLVKSIASHTIRVDKNRRSLQATKDIIQNALNRDRAPVAMEGYASHQWRLRERFVLFSSQGMENVDPSVSKYLARELRRAMENAGDTETVHEAAYGLAVMYLDGILDDNRGTSDKFGLSLLAQSAIAGNDRAQAMVGRTFRALGANLPVECSENIDAWLVRTGSRGYFIALEDMSFMQLTAQLKSSEELLSMRYGGTGAERFSSDMFPSDFPSESENFDASLLEKICAPRFQQSVCSRFGDRILHFVASCNLLKCAAAITAEFPNDVDITNVNGETALLLACRAGNYETAMLLLRAGANASIQNDYGDTPLHWLLSFNAKVMPTLGRALLTCMPDIDAVAESFSYIHCGENEFVHGTPLMRAVTRGRTDVVSFLLDAGANPNLVTEGGSAINVAAQLHYHDILRILLDASKDTQKTIEDASGESLLIAAICGGSLEAPGSRLGRLRRHGEQMETRAQNTLRLLLHAGAREHLSEVPGWPGGTALVLAVTFAQPDIVEYLLDNGCQKLINTPSAVPNDPDQKCTPLMMSILTRNFSMLNLLLKRKADAGELNQIAAGIRGTALHECARQCNDSDAFVRVLFNAGVSINQRPTNYESPVSCAIRSRCFELASSMVELGADLNAEFSAGLFMATNYPMTVLGHLLQECSLSILPCLRFLFDVPNSSQGANFIVCASKGLSALHAVAGTKLEKQDDRALRLIIHAVLENYGVEDGKLDLRTTESGLTALHIAAGAANFTIVERLVREGADTEIKNADGHTPLDVAIAMVKEFPHQFRPDKFVVPQLQFIASARTKVERTRQLLEQYRGV